MIEPIRLEDRISAVLARDERMLDVLLAASPAFSHLRNPLLRKTMAKLATVEHAARVAGLDANELLGRLNAVLGGDRPTTPPPSRKLNAPAPNERPAVVANAAPETIVECDVREDLRSGREPFRRILSTATTVREGQVMRLRAIFEPAPLYGVLGKQGFRHFTERLADDDWCVWFWRDRDHADVEPAKAAVDPMDDPDIVVVDVRGLEPPEPMVRTLEALERLPRGKTLLQLNVRVPQFLLPQLAERGFVHEVREQSPDLVRIFIRHSNS